MVWNHQSYAEDRTCARHTCQKLVIQKCKIKQQPKCFTVIVLIYTDVQLHWWIHPLPHNRHYNSASLCWCSHILQDKLQMTGDIQWTAAGGNIQAQHAQAERKINCSYYSYVHFHTSSTNGVLMRCPLADMVFLPSTNFFAACKENRANSLTGNISKYIPVFIVHRNPATAPTLHRTPRSD